MKNYLNAFLFLAFAAIASTSVANAQIMVDTTPAGPSENDLVVKSGQVSVYELPEDYKQILLIDDKRIFAIEYSLYSTPDKGNILSLPGVSLGQWYSDEVTGKFFPWASDAKDAEDLSRKLSAESKVFLEKNRGELLNNRGDLELYSYSNGGGFIYNSWRTKEPTSKQRPLNPDGSSEGLIYYYNGTLYHTKGGNKGQGRIQAYGGCEANTISKSQNGEPIKVISSQIVESGYCEWEGDQLSSRYAPVFTGGILDFAEDMPVLGNKYWYVKYESENVNTIVGTISNEGSSLSFNGIFTPVDPEGQDVYGNLLFKGDGITYLNNQVRLYGNLDVAASSQLSITSSSSDLISTPLMFLDGKNIKDGKSNNTLTIMQKGVLQVTGNDLDDDSGPRLPGQPSDKAAVVAHRSPVISFNAGDDKFGIESNSLAVVSYVDFLPSQYSKYKTNCQADQDQATCYKAVPQIAFDAGNDKLINEGVLIGPGEASTGNFLEVALGGGDDVVENSGYLGCLTSAADPGGWNGYVGQNTCSQADQLVNDQLPDGAKNELNRNYNVNLVFANGDDTLSNSGYIRGAINMGNGNDSVETSGGIRGSIVLGHGSDTLGIIQNNDWIGSGVIDDTVSLALSKDVDTGDVDERNNVLLQGRAIISFRNSLGFGSDQCGTKKDKNGGYGCRWGSVGSEGAGYQYPAITGSLGNDTIAVGGQKEIHLLRYGVKLSWELMMTASLLKNLGLSVFT